MDDHRSFPEAADGRPQLPMEPELRAAGCDVETSRFVARQLRSEGYYLVRASDLGWPDIRRFQEVLRGGQDVREDGGGFFVRAIMALFGAKPDPVLTYQEAARALLEGVNSEEPDR